VRWGPAVRWAAHQGDGAASFSAYVAHMLRSLSLLLPHSKVLRFAFLGCSICMWETALTTSTFSVVPGMC